MPLRDQGDNHDDDETGIPLLDRESSSSLDHRVPARRAQPSSPIRFAIATALLVLGGFGAFLVWKHGRPAYNTYSDARRPHHKQVHFHNGTVPNESELVRPLFGRATDGELERFDLVATILYKKYEHDEEDDRPPKLALEAGRANTTTTVNATEGAADHAIKTTSFRPLRIYRFDNDEDEGYTFPPEPEWQRLYSEPVIRGLDGKSSRSAIVNVVLPARIVWVEQSPLSYSASSDYGPADVLAL